MKEKESNFLVSSWVFLGDGCDSYGSLPYDKLDYLYIGPGCVKQVSGKYTFGIQDIYKSVLQTVINDARSKNSKVKILISQWWDPTYGDTLSTLKAAQDTYNNKIPRAPLDDSPYSLYAQGVTDFISSTNFDLDGYDIDYESGNADLDDFLILAKLIRQHIGDKLFTVSPVFPSHLSGCGDIIDYVNMQSYAATIIPEFENIFSPDQLFYGVKTEGIQNKNLAFSTVKYGITEALKNNLRGVHNWRLNSTNYLIEDYGQTELYDLVHSAD